MRCLSCGRAIRSCWSPWPVAPPQLCTVGQDGGRCGELGRCSLFLPAHLHTFFPHRRRSFVSFLKQEADKTYHISPSVTTSNTICKSGKHQPVQRVLPSATVATTPAVATTTTNQLIAATASAGPPKKAGQVVTKGLSAAAVGSKPGSGAKLRRFYQSKTDEAMIELALNMRQQGPLLPQPYQQTKVYPPPNRPGATAIPTMWPLPSSSESMAWIVSRSSSSSTCSSSTRIKLTKMKRAPGQHAQQPDKRKKRMPPATNGHEQQSPSPSPSVWPTDPSKSLPPGGRYQQTAKVAVEGATKRNDRSFGMQAEGRELCDGKDRATVAQTLLSLASASYRKSSSTMVHWQERQGKNSSSIGATSATPSWGQQSIHI